MFSEKLIGRLRGSSHIAIMTGAGISAESGVPTFRGEDGLWKNHDVMELATPQALETKSELFWEFYKWRKELLTKVKPNLGHYALVDMENRFSEFTLITQNVDNLHSLAGSKNILEFHGNIMRNRCTSCNYIGYDGQLKIKPEDKLLPKCPECGEMLRPDVVLFGEPLNPQILADAQEASATCEVFFSIGTSSLIEPAASLPYIAKGNGAYLIEINKEETPLSSNADETILGESGKILPLIALALDN